MYILVIFQCWESARTKHCDIQTSQKVSNFQLNAYICPKRHLSLQIF